MFHYQEQREGLAESVLGAAEGPRRAAVPAAALRPIRAPGALSGALRAVSWQILDEIQQAQSLFLVYPV